MKMNQKIYQDKRLVNYAMDAITEIIWPLFRRSQFYDQDILAVKIDFGETDVHQIDAMTVQFPAVLDRNQLGIETICTWTSLFCIESSKVVARIAYG
jgi:hypothetical protein